MSQESSVPQAASFASLVLKRDTSIATAACGQGVAVVPRQQLVSSALGA